MREIRRSTASRSARAIAVVAVAAHDGRPRHRQLEWWLHPDDGDHRDAALSDASDVGGRKVHGVGCGFDLAQGVERCRCDQLRSTDRSHRAFRESALVHVAGGEHHLRSRPHTLAVEADALDTYACFGARGIAVRHRFVGLIRVELRNRHDAVIELESEHRLRDGSHVAYGLLRRLAVVGEDVHLDRSPDPVADDPYREDASEAAKLLFELLKLKWSPFRSDLLGRLGTGPVTRHLYFRPSKGPVPA